MGATWGYARVSTEDQELGLQITALRAAGVPEASIVQEASGKAGSALLERLTRPPLQRASPKDRPR